MYIYIAYKLFFNTLISIMNKHIKLFIYFNMYYEMQRSILLDDINELTSSIDNLTSLIGSKLHEIIQNSNTSSYIKRHRV